MQNQNNFTFKSENKSYTLMVRLYTVSSKNDVLTGAIDIGDIEGLNLSSKLNGMFVEGSLEYIDKYSFIDKFRLCQYRYCHITFAESKKKTDGQSGMSDLDKEKCIDMVFIVDNISQISRQGPIITYRLDLVSSNIMKSMAVLSYSNFDKDKEPLFDIIKTCIKLSGQAVDEESFNKVKSEVSMNYLTLQDDTVVSAVKYLLNKQYYLKKRESSLKFIVYDMHTNKYRALDLKDNTTTVGRYEVVLSFFKTNTEQLISTQPANIGSFANPMSKTLLYKTLFTKRISTYDFNENCFDRCDMVEQRNISYLNNHSRSLHYKTMFEPMLIFPNKKFAQAGSYWSNNFNMYEDAIKSVTEVDSFTLNVQGEVRRQAGSTVMVNIDRSLKDVTSDSKEELEKLKKRYKSYEGLWITSQVDTEIIPNKRRFRQNIALFRNFMMKPVVESDTMQYEKKDEDDSTKKTAKTATLVIVS